MRFLPVNLDVLLVELKDLDETLALFDALTAEPIAGVEEIIPAARTLMIQFRPSTIERQTLVNRNGSSGRPSASATSVAA